MADNTWICTYTGRRFYPLDPRVDDIDIQDIAHALSNICRFTGHVNTFYCPTPEQRILTTGLRWVPAGDLQVGDELVGFDEYPVAETGPTSKQRRHIKPSTVLAVVPVKRRVIRLEMSDGATVRASEEHPWLVATKQSRNQKWRTAREIRWDLKAGRRRYMHRFIEPWTFYSEREVGWLAGIFDGEGYFSAKNRGGIQLGVAQNPGVVLDLIARVLDDLDFEYGATKTGNVASRVISLQLKGGWREAIRLLGAVRPLRLLDKFQSLLVSGGLAKRLDGIAAPSEIIRTYDEGEQWVTGLETSTHTYLCEGFGAHNSVAEHSWRASLCCSFEYLQLALLLHDASEAYLCDVSRPVKHAPGMAYYREAEARLMRAIGIRFGVEFDDPLIHDIDNRMLMTERRDLMPQAEKWTVSAAPFRDIIIPTSPKIAKQGFLQTFIDLTTP